MDALKKDVQNKQRWNFLKRKNPSTNVMQQQQFKKKQKKSPTSLSSSSSTPKRKAYTISNLSLQVLQSQEEFRFNNNKEEFWVLNDQEYNNACSSLVELETAAQTEPRSSQCHVKVGKLHMGAQTTIYHTFQSLKPYGWLWGDVIHAFLEVFQEKLVLQPNVKECLILNDFCFTCIDTDGNEKNGNLAFTKRLTMNDLTKKEIIMPLYFPNHWAVCIISNSKKMVMLLDLLYKNGDKTVHRDNLSLSKIKKWHEKKCKSFNDIPRNYSSAETFETILARDVQCWNI
jgi:Ulp1 family protease